MRRTLVPGCSSLIVLTCLIHGCQEPGISTSLPDGPKANQPAELAKGETAGDPDALTAQAEALAQRVAGVPNVAAQADPEPPRQILWRDLAIEPRADTKIVPEHAPAETTTAQKSPAEHQAEPVPPTQPQANIQAVALAHAPKVDTDQADLSLAQAYRQMLRAIEQGDDPSLNKAVTAATLGAAGPHGELDWKLLSSLSPQDQERVQRYHRAVSMLRDEVLAGDGPVDSSSVSSKLSDVFGSQPITIRTIELCERVSGYGVYDTFPDHTFVAGREQKMIVYVELDNFMPADRGDGEGYEVRLRQELELYESNGYEVWSHEPVQIVDVSKNQRRDFFVVQLVTLPSQLALGEYRLKVRVYDENAGTRDETSIKINIVANDTLVKHTDK